MIRAVVIGTSAGGFNALSSILPALPAHFPLPITVVQHLHLGSGDYTLTYLSQRCAIAVTEARDKLPLLPATAYIAPADYHLSIERDFTLSLSLEPPVNFSRPSIDLLFESAAIAYGGNLAGVILTGANADGARGLAAIKRAGGVTIVEDPKTAQYGAMPLAALAATLVDHVVPVERVAPLLQSLAAGDMSPGTSLLSDSSPTRNSPEASHD
jgi:two-component system chemotaxis response regulator CheB